MEIRTIFYMSIQKGACAGEIPDFRRKGMVMGRLQNSLPYFLWDGKRKTAFLEVYYGLWPEYERRSFCIKGLSERLEAPGTTIKQALFPVQPWRREQAERVLEQARVRIRSEFCCQEEVMAKGFPGAWESVPVQLLAALLYRCAPFERVAVSLPEEGEAGAEEAAWLLYPYLNRVRRVSILGKQSRGKEALREFLQDEFGLVPSYEKRSGKGELWLDLRKEITAGGGFGSENGKGSYVSRGAALNFLDTAVKNGYNTKVN